MNLMTLSTQRYTCKAYDASKKISDADFHHLCQLLRNSPSSVNSQPWHFVVAHTDTAKKKFIQAIAEFNQPRVMNASHVVVLCVRTHFSEAHLQNLLAQEEQDGRLTSAEDKQQQDAGRRYFVGLNSTTPEKLLEWESKQLYIAMSSLLWGAASLGIDATPIEGFDAAKMDELLNLKAQDYTSVAVVSLGYRSAEDFNAKLPKSRLPVEQIFTFLD